MAIGIIESESSDRRAGYSPALEACVAAISQKCADCGQCLKDCAFLQEYGTPKTIADSLHGKHLHLRSMAFECSLCRLCDAVCPAGIRPTDLFEQMRAETVRNGNGILAEHKRILGYEKRGMSKRYSYYAFPEGCDTIYFPGCTLSGTRPAVTWALFEHLKKAFPDLGIVMDCCAKPSCDLGRETYFQAMFGEMKSYLLANGIKHVLVACPSCYQIFKGYGGPLSVRMVYEALARENLCAWTPLEATVTIHDPCTVRQDGAIHDAVRAVCQQLGLNIEEMPHSRNKALCCGEGGAAGSVRPDLAKKWGDLRSSEANGNRIVTYCAGCANLLSGANPTSHLLDVVFDPEAAIAGRSRISKPPWTYLNRIGLKKRFAATLSAPVSRERNFSPEGRAGKSRGWRRSTA